MTSIALASALVLSACGGSNSAVAATVDGAEITVGEVRGLVYDVPSTFPKDQFAGFLGALIQWKALEQAASAEFGIAPTEVEIEAEMASLLESFGPGMTAEEFYEANDISEDGLRRVAFQEVLDRLVRERLGDGLEEPTEDEIAYERVKAAAEVCVSHLLVPTEEAALEAMERIDDGEDFADVADEVSIDTSSEGGDLDCHPPARYVDEFGKATVEADLDEIFGPVETQFGFHVILVTDRTLPDDDELTDEATALEALRDAAIAIAFNDWSSEVILAAEVSVDPEYGTWQAGPQPQVIPPA